MMDTRRRRPDERLVFEPCTREAFEESCARIAAHNLFPAGEMGNGRFEDAIFADPPRLPTSDCAAASRRRIRRDTTGTLISVRYSKRERSRPSCNALVCARARRACQRGYKLRGLAAPRLAVATAMESAAVKTSVEPDAMSEDEVMKVEKTVPVKEANSDDDKDIVKPARIAVLIQPMA